MESDMNLKGPADHQQKQQKGVTTVEYAVMLVLVAIAVIAFGPGLAGSVTGVLTQITNAL